MSATPVLTPEQVRAVEMRAAGEKPPLMERAGAAVARAARELAADTGGAVIVVAGPGNNGGDAWVAAAHLAREFHRVIVYDVTGAAPKAAEARAARAQFTKSGGEIVSEWPAIARPALVIDGLLGIGLARGVDPPLAKVIERINESRAPVLAIDVPSGLDAATGVVRGSAVRATRTITFLGHKIGLLTGDALDHCGAICVDDLGVAADVAREARGALLTREHVAPWLSARPHNSHKGDFGSVAVIGGNRGMVGAALLAGRAALAAGAGRVRLGLLTPEPPAADYGQPELMLGSVDDALALDVIVAGPGAGQSPSATSVSMFERNVLPALFASSKPIVLDADALNAVAYNDALREALEKRKGGTILTPHPGEAARLLGRTTADVQAHRLDCALELARRMHADVVLKGAGSICAFRDGRWAVNTSGNPGLASAGSGDVLAGIVGALLAQGLEAPRALQYGVCLHGAAADALVARGIGPTGLTAGMLVGELPRLINAWIAGAKER